MLKTFAYAAIFTLTAYGSAPAMAKRVTFWCAPNTLQTTYAADNSATVTCDALKVGKQRARKVKR